MLKPVAEFIAEAQSRCDCLDLDAAKSLYDQMENAVIIDVREPNEAAENKLTSSIHIPRGLLEMKITESCPDSDQLIFTHCGAGGRASLAADRLQEMGYTNVHVIVAKFDDIKAAFG